MKDSAAIAFVCGYIVVLIAAFVGWVLNLVTVVGMIGGDITGEFVVRCVGVIAVPLGAVLG